MLRVCRSMLCGMSKWSSHPSAAIDTTSYSTLLFIFVFSIYIIISVAVPVQSDAPKATGTIALRPRYGPPVTSPVAGVDRPSSSSLLSGPFFPEETFGDHSSVGKHFKTEFDLCSIRTRFYRHCSSAKSCTYFTTLASVYGSVYLSAVLF